MRTINKIAFLFFFLCCSVIIQAQDFPKTIYELYNLSKVSDTYLDIEKYDNLMFIEVEDYEDANKQQAPIPQDAIILKKTNALLRKFKKATKSSLIFSAPTKKVLRNGNFCFLKNGKWGLKNATEKVILPPQFDFIVVDTFAGGFVGYQKTLSNYYDGKTGKKVLKKDYYSVKAVDKFTFIIQSKNGYGIIHQGEIIIPPIEHSISKTNVGNHFYYDIFSKNADLYILLNDYTTKIQVSNEYTPLLITADFILFEHDLYSLKTQKCLICNTGFSLRLIDEKEQLLSIKSGRHSSSYLIDFEGNIIAKQKFVEITPLHNDISVNTITIKTEQNLKIRKKGFMNSQGDWTLSPQYKLITQQGKYYIATNFSKKTGLIDVKGNIILPFKYDFISYIKANDFLCGYNQKGEVNSKILTTPSGKIRQDSLHYKNIKTSTFCTNNYFTAYLEKGQQIIDENYQPITKIYDYISFEKNYLKAKIRSSAIPKTDKFNLYTCDGERVYFEINGKKTGTFDVIKVLNEQLTYVYLDNEMGYLIPAKGQVIPFNHYINIYRELYGGELLILGKNYSNTWGIIDNKGKTVLPFVFNKVRALYGDSQLIQLTTAEEKTGFFSSKGNLFTKRLYDDIRYLGLGLYTLMEKNGKDEKWGLVNVKGKRIFPIEYNWIFLNGGLIYAKKGKNTLIFDRTGKLIR